MATLNTEIILAQDLVNRNLPIYDVQRAKNNAWIDRMKMEQISHISKYGNACFPGSIVLIKLAGISYIADGQHREQVMRDLINAGYNLYIKIVVETYDCGTDRDLARNIYLFSNEKYEHNAGVDVLRLNQNLPTHGNNNTFITHNQIQLPIPAPTPVPAPTPRYIPVPAPTPRYIPVPAPTPVYIPVPAATPRHITVPAPTARHITVPVPTNIQMHVTVPTPTNTYVPTYPKTHISPEIIMSNLRAVCSFVGNTYLNQQSFNDSCPAPKFNLANLERELFNNGEGIITKLQPDRIIAIISEENAKLGQTLPQEKKNKCTAGFFLPYHQHGAKCRWVRKIFENAG